MRLASAIVLLVLVAGCTDPEQGSNSDQQSPTTATPGTPTPYPKDCQPYGTGAQDCQDLLLAVSSKAAGAFDLGIPFPHGAWCLQGDQWLAGERTPDEADVLLVQTERGSVLRLTGDGPFSWHARILVDDLATCQTFRYDPWSIDPDTDPGKGMDVHVWSGTLDEVVVQQRTGGCTSKVTYTPDGSLKDGWNLLDATVGPTSCA